jgi:ATP adenylyltransferase
MNHLYSPWRMPYIESDRSEAGCIFCERLKEEDGPQNLIFHRGPNSFAILNRFPYNNGHLMIVPYEHVPTIEDLEAQVLSELMAHTAKAVAVLREEYGAESFNVGINIGEAAGAGVAEHVHIHVLPRWPGDTSFLTVTTGTRVLPEALDRTYRRIRAGWENVEEGP